MNGFAYIWNVHVCDRPYPTFSYINTTADFSINMKPKDSLGNNIFFGKCNKLPLASDFSASI